MNFSYWELKEWFTNIDFTIVGSGIVGLNCAIQLKEKYPKAKIIILEKGMLPQGASTKNAGFACFGSLSEILEDLKTHSEEEVFGLIKKRWEGLQILRQNLGDTKIDFKKYFGYELFNSSSFYEECISQKQKINQLLNPIFKKDVFTKVDNIYDFKNIHVKYIKNNFEGQIDTGKMAYQLVLKAQKKGIKIIRETSLLRGLF
mgnify:CR=1 FL=1